MKYISKHHADLYDELVHYEDYKSNLKKLLHEKIKGEGKTACELGVGIESHSSKWVR